jgi:large subunit ribosomal protein L19e
MNLRKKKALTARTFGVGLARVEFVEARLEEIKEAITKQDIRDLQKDGAIIIKNVKGRKRNKKNAKNRSVGNVRKRVNKRKKEYVIITRKLRKHLREVNEKLTEKEKKDLRKKIRNRFFKSKSHLKEHLGGNKK